MDSFCHFVFWEQEQRKEACVCFPVFVFFGTGRRRWFCFSCFCVSIFHLFFHFPLIFDEFLHMFHSFSFLSFSSFLYVSVFPHFPFWTGANPKQVSTLGGGRCGGRRER